MNYQAKFETAGACVPDGLLAGNAYLLVARQVTVAAGAGVVKRGAVLGKIAASGKYTLSAAAADDGSQTPDLILAQTVDATAADVQALAYSRGDFAAPALTLGAGHTLAGVTESLRTKGITLLPAMAA